MSLAVKICGLSTAAAVEATVTGGAAYAGFVFFAPSPRALTPGQAAPLRARLPRKVQAVALTVDASDAALAEIAETVRPDLFQLHGTESPVRVAEIRTRFARPVIKALPISQKEDLATVPAYAAVADLLLFDAKPLPADTRPGGNARPFDWTILAGLALDKPWLLAGGLNLENVAAAVKASGARIVDISSGVERAPGEKDPALIRAFLDHARTL